MSDNDIFTNNTLDKRAGQMRVIYAVQNFKKAITVVAC